MCCVAVDQFDTDQSWDAFWKVETGKVWLIKAIKRFVNQRFVTFFKSIDRPTQGTYGSARLPPSNCKHSNTGPMHNGINVTPLTRHLTHVGGYLTTLNTTDDLLPI